MCFFVQTQVSSSPHRCGSDPLLLFRLWSEKESCWWWTVVPFMSSKICSMKCLCWLVWICVVVIWFCDVFILLKISYSYCVHVAYEHSWVFLVIWYFFVMFDSELWKEKRGICLEFAAATVVFFLVSVKKKDSLFIDCILGFFATWKMTKIPLGLWCKRQQKYGPILDWHVDKDQNLDQKILNK